MIVSRAFCRRTKKRVIAKPVCTLQQTGELKNPGLHLVAKYWNRHSYSLRYCAWARDRFIRINEI